MSEEAKETVDKKESGDGCKCCKCKAFVKRHKKLSWTILIVVVVLAVLRISLGVIVKSSVSTVAPLIAGVPVTIGDVSISVCEGYMALSNVKVGNPEGFNEKNMLTLEKAVFDIGMCSLFSKKLRIEEITVQGLKLYYEQKLTTNNISTLQANLEKNLGTAEKTAEEKPAPEKKEKPAESKKLQVDKIQMNDITTYVVVPGGSIPVMMIPINMENLGTGPDGITAGEVFVAILNKLSLGAADAAVEASKKAGSKTWEALKGAGTGIGDGVGKGTDAVKKLFK